MNRANDFVLLISERFPKVMHEFGQTCSLDEGLRPHPIVQLFLRHRFRAVLDENLKQLERFGTKSHGLQLRAVQQLPSIRIKDEVVKANAHYQNSSCRASATELDYGRRWSE